MGHANVSVFVPHIGCPNQCSFCNQCSISGQQSAPTPDDVKQVCEQALQLRGKNLEDTQLAFFGGSFTAIEKGYMLSLLQAAKPYIGKDGFSGIRISTRPDAISDEILSILKEYHVTAIELGVQSMKDNVLQLNRRGHTAQDVADAVHKIHHAGIELGLQMMTGLYGSTQQDDFDTARQIAAFCPKTVRIYPTVTIRGTLLEQYYREGKYLPPTLEQSVKLCSELLEFFETQGIQVIRLGLHASQTLEQDLVAGPYHQAFRELCEGELYLKKAQKLIEEYPAQAPLFIYVSSGAVSKMVGQKRKNILILEKRNPVKVCADPTMQGDCIRVCLQQSK